MIEQLGNFWGERLEDGTITFVPLKEPAPPTEVSLPAFYFSQWDRPGTIDSIDVDADDRRGDCGPACLTSIIAHLKREYPTVDQVATACGQPTAGPGANYTNHYQLRQGAAYYGVTLASRTPGNRRPLTVFMCKEEVFAGRPVIALINYGTLRDRLAYFPAAIQNQDSFRGAHFVLVVGYRLHPVLGWCLEVNDPDFWQPRRSDGNHRLVPLAAFDQALRDRAGSNRWGSQGLVVTSPIGRLI
jgi:hypothetical protein